MPSIKILFDSPIALFLKAIAQRGQVSAGIAIEEIVAEAKDSLSPLRWASQSVFVKRAPLVPVFSVHARWDVPKHRCYKGAVFVFYWDFGVPSNLDYVVRFVIDAMGSCLCLALL